MDLICLTYHNSYTSFLLALIFKLHVTCNLHMPAFHKLITNQLYSNIFPFLLYVLVPRELLLIVSYQVTILIQSDFNVEICFIAVSHADMSGA